MLTYKNNSDTMIVVLHEIYGINHHIKNVCEKLAVLNYDVVCPALFDLKEPFAYDREDEAYQNFVNHIGFDAASKRVTDILIQLQDKYQRIVLLGYSIGATTGWLCSETNIKCDGVIGFYGSRIRDYLEVTPKCPMLLFFPQEEKSFDTTELADQLKKKEKVDVHLLEGKHGFADPFSVNYHERSYNVSKQMVEDLIDKI